MHQFSSQLVSLCQPLEHCHFPVDLFNHIVCMFMSFQVVYELPTSNQWCFDVQWCPRNPALISSCSFDSHVSVYSLMGGQTPQKTPSKVRQSTTGFSNSSWVFYMLP